MNISKFLVLGALEQIGQGSGYDIFTDLEDKKIDKWTGIKKGSIYFAIKQLLRDDHIIEVMEIKQGAYPTKTIYRITESGKAFFDKMQIQAFDGLFPSFLGFKIGLKFNMRCTSEEIIMYANKAIKKIDNAIENMISFQNDTSTSDDYKFFIEHDIMLFKQERRWIEMVIKRYSK